MAKYVIYSDLHIGSPYGMNLEIIPDKNVVLLGDNFEMKNALREEIERVKILREKVLKRINEVGGVFLDGNHELKRLNPDNFFVKKKEIIFIHGDVIEWGFKKANRKRGRHVGLKKPYWHIMKIFRKFILDETKPREKHFWRAWKIAQVKNAKTIVIGHFHPKKTIEKIWKGIRIIFVPRGKTIIDL